MAIARRNATIISSIQNGHTISPEISHQLASCTAVPQQPVSEMDIHFSTARASSGGIREESGTASILSSGAHGEVDLKSGGSTC